VSWIDKGNVATLEKIEGVTVKTDDKGHGQLLKLKTQKGKVVELRVIDDRIPYVGWFFEHFPNIERHHTLEVIVDGKKLQLVYPHDFMYADFDVPENGYITLKVSNGQEPNERESVEGAQNLINPVDNDSLQYSLNIENIIEEEPSDYRRGQQIKIKRGKIELDIDGLQITMEFDVFYEEFDMEAYFAVIDRQYLVPVRLGINGSMIDFTEERSKIWTKNIAIKKLTNNTDI